MTAQAQLLTSAGFLTVIFLSKSTPCSSFQSPPAFHLSSAQSGEETPSHGGRAWLCPPTISEAPSIWPGTK
jgi:hypothetical protein